MSCGDDDEGNDPAVKVSKSGPHSGDGQSPSTVASIPENSTPDITMQLVDSLNTIQHNLEVTTTSHPRKLVTPSLKSLFPS